MTTWWRYEQRAFNNRTWTSAIVDVSIIFVKLQIYTHCSAQTRCVVTRQNSR